MLKTAFIALLAAAPAQALSLPEFNLNSLKAPQLRTAAPEVPAPAPAQEKAGYIQMTSSVKLKMDKEKGELTVAFPKVEFGSGTPQDKAYLFVKLTRELPAPAISWATVLCSGENFLGYKGSNVDFPDGSGSFSIGETLALGYPKKLIADTHPWLAGGLADLNGLCGAPFLEKMKDARVETLPQKSGDFSFDYNIRRNTLKVTW